MARSYSIDLREWVLNDIDSGMSTEDAARKYSVSISWAYSLKKQRRESGAIAPKQYKPGPKLKLAPFENEVRQAVVELYKRRNEVERYFRRLKSWRRVFTRYDKLDIMYSSFVVFAMICEILCR